MAVQFRLSNAKREQLLRLVDPLLEATAREVAEECNRQSSWGGYVARAEEGVAIVHATAHAAEDAARHQRLLVALHGRASR